MITHNQTDCRSREGIAVGLVDGIIAMARVLRRMNMDLEVSEPVAYNEALKDLRSDEDVAWLMTHKLIQ